MIVKLKGGQCNFSYLYWKLMQNSHIILFTSFTNVTPFFKEVCAFWNLLSVYTLQTIMHKRECQKTAFCHWYKNIKQIYANTSFVSNIYWFREYIGFILSIDFEDHEGINYLFQFLSLDIYNKWNEEALMERLLQRCNIKPFTWDN